MSSAHCLSEHDLRLSVHLVEKVFIGYLLPPLIVCGLTGNSLTLFVLLSPRMASPRSNTLLATLALLDVVFLLLMLPNSLAHFDLFAKNFTFRRLYFATRIHCLALLNQCSAAAIWIVLGICLERLAGIRRPFSACKSRSRGTQLFVGAVALGTFLLTLYVHLSYRCLTKFFCNGTQVYSYCTHVDANRPFHNGTVPNMDSWPTLLVAHYVRVSPIVHAILVVFLPTLIVAISNLALLWTLHKRDSYLLLSSTRSDASSYSQSLNSTQSQNSAQQQKIRTENRVTITAVAIITSFTITQTPSAIVQLFASPVGLTNPHQHLKVLSLFLIVLGKSINFILFCMSSAHFRLQLAFLINAKLRGRTEMSYTIG